MKFKHLRAVGSESKTVWVVPSDNIIDIELNDPELKIIDKNGNEITVDLE